MVDTDIFVNGFKSKDNPNLRWCKVDDIAAGYIPVSKKGSRGLIKTTVDDTPEADTFKAGDLILCTKQFEEKAKEEKKKGE